MSTINRIGLFFLGLLSSTGLFAQINVSHVDNNLAPSEREGIYYALPRTVIRIDVSIDRIENFKGPYSEYALKYLGMKNVVEANSVEYKIMDIDVKTSAQPDPDQYFFVELGDKISKNGKDALFSLTESGLILGTIPDKSDTLVKEFRQTKQDNPQAVTEKDVFPEIFKYSADASFVEKVDTIIRKVNIDTMTLQRQYVKRTMVEKSPEQKAKEAADYITKIKDNRFNLISGFQEVNYNKETLEYMDAQLTTLEKEYLKLFTGISVHRTMVFTYVYTPNQNQINAEVPIFKFQKTKGVIDLDEPGGKVVTIRVQRSGTTSSVLNYLKKVDENKKGHGFYYRIPELARVNVKVDDNLQEETQCLVSQLGIVTYLPVNKWKVQFYKETGGIRDMLVE